MHNLVASHLFQLPASVFSTVIACLRSMNLHKKNLQATDAMASGTKLRCIIMVSGSSLVGPAICLRSLFQLSEHLVRLWPLDLYH